MSSRGLSRVNHNPHQLVHLSLSGRRPLLPGRDALGRVGLHIQHPGELGGVEEGGREGGRRGGREKEREREREGEGKNERALNSAPPTLLYSSSYLKVVIILDGSVGFPVVAEPLQVNHHH